MLPVASKTYRNRQGYADSGSKIMVELRGDSRKTFSQPKVDSFYCVTWNPLRSVKTVRSAIYCTATALNIINLFCFNS
ncbi:hypothetical protein PL78_15850 [Yersinia entomophaga]|uniref:Uncharacterized protein n=1 Tax=Yersinia entomophaga TaxID=935293 RepID=A0ABN4Q281_YERET|nr:hypothetical protein PL78_15850 [Yersinia entomophaga]OWF90072.1 hypothetical protein B4914_00715 [Yersinia entomophaga]